MPSHRYNDRGVLTSHGRVLVCIARDPTSTIRELAEAVGATQRSVFGCIVDLERGGMITRTKIGRRNTYVVHRDVDLDWLVAGTVGDLLDAFR